MIASITYSSAFFEKIDGILFNEDVPVPVLYRKRRIEFFSDLKQYKRTYKYNFIAFPVDTIPNADRIYINSDFIIGYKKYHAIRNKFSNETIENEVEKYDKDSVVEFISDIIHERISNLSFEFEAALKHAKASYIFAGITDNVIIIRNLLSHYRNVLNSPNIQISHFSGLSLPKVISDVMTEVYIYYLSDRLEMMEIQSASEVLSVSEVVDDGLRIKWNGRQQDLAELFIELERKNWTTRGELSMIKVCTLLSKVFDLSDTKRKHASNSAASLYQLFKGSYPEESRGDRRYFFDDKKHKRQFENIKEFNKS
ncbi:hypothetical protein [Mucilaginibacter psychrotolerans]|uniref:Uncharacterized protein n=1 Tax=Mucilaginibacter psychrotolerans TaxID=1524096 RepID=A0A4Y8SHJ5_9SPHI|nr:hypothetical protein [Mucilaginibacter psychrotolerans]TFF37934.1 hypothetical protein E2R66_10110 [Mucilaginibacter psychrotolerans]